VVEEGCPIGVRGKGEGEKPALRTLMIRRVEERTHTSQQTGALEAKVGGCANAQTWHSWEVGVVSRVWMGIVDPDVKWLIWLYSHHSRLSTWPQATQAGQHIH